MLSSVYSEGILYYYINVEEYEKKVAGMTEQLEEKTQAEEQEKQTNIG